MVRVAIPVPLPQLFDYLTPAGIDPSAIARGTRVSVPFGRGRRVGVVVAVATTSDIPRARLKAIA
ncbi:MAG: hypothetical protein JSS13_03180, partial [Proteobacteria bacterium]|nr:hypothetical protein [Pseudomonadota bacterium]